MKLHQRGVDLLVNVQDALSHAHTLSEKDVRELLKETEFVLRQLLARDVPVEDAGEKRKAG